MREVGALVHELLEGHHDPEPSDYITYRAAFDDALAIDPFRAARLQPALVTAGSSAGQGQTLLSEDAVWLSPAAAQALGLAVGDRFDVQVALDPVSLRVAGLLPAGEYRQPLGMLDIATAQWRLDRLGRLDRVDLRLVPGADPLAVQDAMRALLPPGVRLTTPGEASDDVRLAGISIEPDACARRTLHGRIPRHATQSPPWRGVAARLRCCDGRDRPRAAGRVVAWHWSAHSVPRWDRSRHRVARAGLAAFGADLGASTQVCRAACSASSRSAIFFLLGVAAAVVAISGAGP
jgi:hypothetical protein